MEPFRRAFAVGEVDVEQHEIAEVRDDGPPFAVEPVSKAVLDALWRFIGVEAHPAITLLLWGGEVRTIPSDRPDLFGQVLFVGFGLLEAHDVDTLAIEPVEKSLLVSRSETVYIPGYNPHGTNSLLLGPK